MVNLVSQNSHQQTQAEHMDTLDSYLEKGNDYKQKEKWEDAIACYRTFLETHPENWQVYQYVGDCLINLKRWEEASEAYRQVLKVKPDFVWAHHNLGIALVNLEQFEEAYECFEKVKSLKPDFWDWAKVEYSALLQCKLGDYLFRQQRWEEAVTCYRILLKIEPENWQAQHHLGDCLLNLKHWERSTKAYRKVLKMKPDFVWAHHNLGIALVNLERFEEAYECFEKVKKHKPDFWDVAKVKYSAPLQCKVGDYLFGQQRWEDAVAVYKRVLALNPNFIFGNHNLADALRKLGHSEIFQIQQKFSPLKSSDNELMHSCFDASYYLEKNPDVKDAGLDPFQHFMQFGFREGRNPHPLFNTSYYLEKNPDVKDAGLNPLAHFLEFGIYEGRNPHPLFNTSYYLEKNPDVKDAGLNPVEHFLEFGFHEGKDPNPFLSIAAYKEQNPDIHNFYPNPFLYYLEKGERSQDFSCLPWKYSNGKVIDQKGHYDILIFSHDATRTGAPKVLLAFIKQLKELGQLEDINIWIVLNCGGELEEDFQQCAPTINLDMLARWSSDYDLALRKVLEGFKNYTHNGVVFINTCAISNVNKVCQQMALSVLTWVHELPVTIDTYCGGKESFQNILTSSQKIISVSDFVKSSLINYSPLEDQNDKFTTIYASPPSVVGHDSNISSIGDYRKHIEAEFNLPKDSFIVMGCGTVTKRKGCDIFVQVANQVINGFGIENAFFFWLGESFGNEYIKWLEHDIESLGLENRVVFAGKRKDPSVYMKGSDVFILTSREDPFPLVNLEAMYYGLTVISFQEGGGAPEIYGGKRGISVPYLDVMAMAQAVFRLKGNPSQRKSIGLKAQEYIKKELTWSNFVYRFIDLVKQDYDYHESKELKLTVIIPNYNHEKFIKDRIESIVNQTVKPDEIIFLDDKSSDRSASIATELLSKSNIPYRTILNEENTGSPFKQWAKGIEAATGDLVWIAESDDLCKLNLIENLKTQFYDPEVTIAYVQSAPMGEDNQLFADNYLAYTEEIDAERWKSYYKDEGIQEISLSMCFKNTMPNASAVMFRRKAVKSDCISRLRKYRLVGDWLLYFSVLKEGKVAFIPEAINYHRRHSGTITSKIEKEDRHAQEILDLKQYIFDHPFIDANSISESVGRTIDDYYSLDKRHGLGRVDLTDNSSLTESLRQIKSDFDTKFFRNKSEGMSILFIVGDAEFGGGQIAGIRLANELAKNHRVFMCNARPWVWNDDLIGLVDSSVILLEGTLKPTVWSNNKEQRLKVVQELVNFHQIDTIFSHVWWADRFAYELNQKLKLSWFIRMHGCYEFLAENSHVDPKFAEWVEPIMNSISGICYSADKNLAVFNKFQLSPPNKMIKLFNGFDKSTVEVLLPGDNLIKREEGDFIFCLCSRAIPAKGWEEAIEAVININNLPLQQRNHKTARLMLIGDSDYAQGLKQKYAHISEIQFLGQEAKPVNFYAQCDVGLLPSKFKSESVPSTVIEYLACDLPVIATSVGSVPEMITFNGNDAGFIVPLSDDWQIDVNTLEKMMLKYMTDKEVYRRHQINAKEVFDNLFEIQKLSDKYTEFFKK